MEIHRGQGGANKLMWGRFGGKSGWGGAQEHRREAEHWEHRWAGSGKWRWGTRRDNYKLKQNITNQNNERKKMTALKLSGNQQWSEKWGRPSHVSVIYTALDQKLPHDASRSLWHIIQRSSFPSWACIWQHWWRGTAFKQAETSKYGRPFILNSWIEKLIKCNNTNIWLEYSLELLWFIKYMQGCRVYFNNLFWYVNYYLLQNGVSNIIQVWQY